MAIQFNRVPTGIDLVDQNLQRLEETLLAFSPSVKPNVVTVSGDYRVNGTEDVIHVDSSKGAVRITMPQPSSALRPLIIKQTNLQTGKSKVNPVTVASPDGQRTIAGNSTYALDATGTGSVSFSSDDSQHWPSAGSGGNPAVLPASPPAPPFIPTPTPTPTPPPASTPWVAPVPFGDVLAGDPGAGAETWCAESLVDFTGSPGSVTVYWWFQSLSSSGNATFNLRVGGSTYKALDGGVVATWSEPNAAMTARSVTPVVIAPPSGIKRVTVTAQSSGAGQKAQIQGINLLFR